MKNKMLIVSLSLVAALTFFGCNSTPLPSEEASPVSTDESIVSSIESSSDEGPMTVEKFYSDPENWAALDEELAEIIKDTPTIPSLVWEAQGDVLSYIYTFNVELSEEEIKSAFTTNLEKAVTDIDVIKTKTGAEKADFRVVLKNVSGDVYMDVTFHEDGTYDGTLSGAQIDEETPEPVTVESFFKDPKNAEKKTDELNEIASYSGSAIAHIDWEAKEDTFTYIYYFNNAPSQSEIDSALKTNEENKQGTIDALLTETGATEAKVRFIFIDRDGNEILNQLIELDS